jgi:hypothetical protein
MTYPELRKQLRAAGFINHEIAALHHGYLVVHAMGIPDADLVFDRDHGLLVHQRSRPLLEKYQGAQAVVDCDNHTAVIRPA